MLCLYTTHLPRSGRARHSGDMASTASGVTSANVSCSMGHCPVLMPVPLFRYLRTPLGTQCTQLGQAPNVHRVQKVLQLLAAKTGFPASNSDRAATLQASAANSWSST